MDYLLHSSTRPIAFLNVFIYTVTMNANDPSSQNALQSATLPYFAPLLPWQSALWQRLTHSQLSTTNSLPIDSLQTNNLQTNALTTTNKLPHALLASGMAGIGKREFIWRWIAWQLCHNKPTETACGSCESCNWLLSGTHPDLYILPATSSPTHGMLEEQSNSRDTGKKKSKNKTSNKPKNKANTQATTKIKIDDIRQIQNFVHQGSQNLRICVFDHAENMTLAAANALLKTLEEPRQGVQLILISDHPSLLLATIRSRVQQLPLNQIDHTLANNYVQQQLAQLSSTESILTDYHHASVQSEQLLTLSGYAPLQAVKIAQTPWYQQRKLWLTTWLALRNLTRTAVQASDYWQSQLVLSDFIHLSQVMLMDLQRLSCNLPTHQQDIDFSSISQHNMPNSIGIHALLLTLQEVDQGIKQNVQDKLAYDMLMQSLVDL